MKVNLNSSMTTNTEQEIRFVYKLGMMWEKEHCIKPNKGGIMYLFSDKDGNKAFCNWLRSKGIETEINQFGELGTVVDFDDGPNLTKLLLEQP